MHIFSVVIVLMVVWLLLSGIFTPLIIGFGVASCLLVALITWRMDVLDREGQPVHLGAKLFTYWLWLLKEIFKANIDVAYCVFFPGKCLRPSLFSAEATQKSDMGRVIYANSITLTPGTVTVDLHGNRILVHALTTGSAEGVRSGEMDRRVTDAMGES